MRVGEHLSINADHQGWYCPTCDTHWHSFTEITKTCTPSTKRRGPS